MKQYNDCIQHILDTGIQKGDRTGTGTIEAPLGYMMRFDLAEGFPMVTTKKLHMRSIIHELLWFIKGDTNVKYLQDNNVTIWDEWANEEGDLGPVYGAQWRNWLDDYHGRNIDQLQQVISDLRSNPNSRRHIVSAWNVAEIEDMALPPCHMMFQFLVQEGKLSCLMYQRSVDAFLGLPFNIASYALLTHMVAQVTGLGVGHLVHTSGSLHLYNNHLDQAKELLSRDPEKYSLPTLFLNNDVRDIDHFTYNDIRIQGYQSYPTIKAEVSV